MNFYSVNILIHKHVELTYSKLRSIIEREGFKYEKLLAVCTDGRPAMLSCRFRSMKHDKESTPHVIGITI